MHCEKALLVSHCFNAEKDGIIIVGPTGSGKTDLALQGSLFLREHGKESCIIGADCRQFYEGLPLLTALPSEDERQGFTHLWCGSCAYDHEQVTAVDWACDVAKHIDELRKRNVFSIVVGGSGFYLDVLLKGICALPPIGRAQSQKLREQLEPKSTRELYEELQRIDRDLALRLAPSDRQRLIRGLSVFYATQRPLSVWHAEGRKKCSCAAEHMETLWLSPPRAVLHERLSARLEQMIAKGAIEEVQTFRKRPLAESSVLCQTIGYRFISAFLEGSISYAAALQRTLEKTRQYAKRQETWFANRFPSRWKSTSPSLIAPLHLGRTPG